MKKHFSIFLLLALGLTGCQSIFGPSALHNTHPAYNQAMLQTLNEQMLLNLVRLKYRDSPYFLKVNSVTAALTFSGDIGMSSSIDLAPNGNVLQPKLGISYADSPTISFQPLYGEDFLKSIMSSISFNALLIMAESGWRINRILGLCVERINNIYNSPRASGPTPSLEPEYLAFKRVMQIIAELQKNHELEIGLNDDKEPNIKFKITPTNRDEMNELANLLLIKIEPEQQEVMLRLDSNFLNIQPNELNIRPRSIANIMFYLSQNVEVPQEHIEQGLVTVTKTMQNTVFNWRDTPGGQFFQVKMSDGDPDDAFLKVPYRGYWFYIADNDLNSKSTFLLLNQLFDLQAGQTKYSGPTLTLPVR